MMAATLIAINRLHCRPAVEFLILLAMFAWTGLPLEAAPHEPAVFENEIRLYERRDTASPPPDRPIVFVGSSSIRMWTNLSEAFPGYPVLNRGFGGAHAADVNFFFDRIVGKYHPSAIVYYAGDNDIAAEISPDQVLAEFREFTRRVNDRVGDIPVAFIAIKPSPSRLKWAAEQKRANRLIRDFVGSHTNLTYLDVWPPMTDEKGQARGALFLADQLHMNGAGYAIWRGIVGDWLLENYRRQRR
jgi:lysophospholipase L1-like esterase